MTKEQTMNKRGKFITILGVNGIGKTTQTGLLKDRMISEGLGKTEVVKYPRYDFPPLGSRLNAYVRGGNPDDLTPREFQILNALQRAYIESEVRTYIGLGINVIGEDYTGTGFAWGIGTGVDKDFLSDINHHLLKEDLAILLHGVPFNTAIEEGHAHEGKQKLIEKVRDIHHTLARELGWKEVNANDTEKAVHECIWGIVRTRFDRQL